MSSCTGSLSLRACGASRKGVQEEVGDTPVGVMGVGRSFKSEEG